MVNPCSIFHVRSQLIIATVYCLQKVPAAKWLGSNVFLWGVAAAASAGAHDYRGLLAARVFLGIFEATVGPSLMLISSQYYTRSEQAPRFTFWYMGLGVAQILGGIISFAFQHVHHASLDGWRIMFLVLGLITAVVGTLTFFFIPDTPIKAKWLSESEKVALLEHVGENQTGVWSTTLSSKQIWESVFDIQLWLLTLTTILVRGRPFAQSYRLTPFLDLCIEWCCDYLFLDSDCRFRLLGSHLSPPQYSLGYRQHFLYSSSRIRYPKGISPLGLECSMYYPRHHRRRPTIFPPEKQHSRCAHRYLSRQRYRGNTTYSLPVDHGQLCRSH